MAKKPTIFDIPQTLRLIDLRAGLKCFLSVPWVITQTEHNGDPNTKMKKKFLNLNIFLLEPKLEY